jgi:hypothetical protein
MVFMKSMDKLHLTNTIESVDWSKEEAPEEHVDLHVAFHTPEPVLD